MCSNQLHLPNPEASLTADRDNQLRAMESGAYRARAIAIDVAALRRQGVEPVPDFFGIAEQFVSGSLSVEQFMASIDDLRHRHAPPEPASG
jgi:predicted DsbA family dithiol-disulfide isomerase